MNANLPDPQANKKKSALNSAIGYFGQHTLAAIVLAAILMCGLLIGTPALLMKFGAGKSPTNKELVTISGHLRSIEKTSTNGKSPQQIIYLSINEDSRQFKIDEHGISAINQLDILTPGTQISFSISKSESDRSSSSSEINILLNALFEWRKIPTVYELRTEREILLRLDSYNSVADASNIRALYLGIAGFLVLVARISLRCIRSA